MVYSPLQQRVFAKIMELEQTYVPSTPKTHQFKQHTRDSMKPPIMNPKIRMGHPIIQPRGQNH